MSKDTATYRDDELGAALRELDVPAHGPEFYTELHYRLADERALRLVDARRRRRAGSLRWGIRAALVAAVSALAFAALDVVRSDEHSGSRIVGVEIATAAEIKAHVREALSAAENLSGLLVFDGSEKGDETRSRFVLTARGDFRLDGITRTEKTAYDAGKGVERFYSKGEGFTVAAISRGVAPGRPDYAGGRWILPNEFGSLVRAFLASEDPRVTETTYEGRPAWRLEVKAIPNALSYGLSGDRFSITVDRRTGMPVKVVERAGGQFVREIRIEHLSVDRKLAPDAFTFRFPEGIRVNRLDYGFRRVGLARVESIVGYAPLVPSWVPEGYELQEVAVARRAGPTGAEGANPPSEDVVSLSYRRGLDQFVTTTRLARPPHGLAPEEGLPPMEVLWDDPLATGEGFVDRPERVLVRRGALAGVELELLIVPRNIPHVWALTDELVVTVSGDLSRGELLHVAESLRRQR